MYFFDIMNDHFEQRVLKNGFYLRQFPPAPALRDYVQGYWVLQHTPDSQTQHHEFMHADGGFGLIFNFGDVFQLDDVLLPQGVFLDGTNTVSRMMHWSHRVDAVGIRFRVGGAYPFLGLPLRNIRNHLNLNDVLGRETVHQLFAQMQERTQVTARLKLLDLWLMQRFRQGFAQADVIPFALRALRQADAPVSIAQLADNLYIGQRQLERIFREQVGMTPINYARLLRVAQVRNALKTQMNRTLTEIGADFGYYDQAHFIRDFKAVVGLTPGNYQQRSASRADITPKQDPLNHE